MKLLKRLKPVFRHTLILCGTVTISGTFQAEPWNQFRGPSGQGVTLADDLPTQWSNDKNITWKTPIHDRGWSSPIVQNQRIWLTTASREGKQLYAVAVDAASGAVLYDKELFHVNEPQFAHDFNSYASPTPVADESHVFITFGSPGTACLDAENGNLVWERTDIECNHFRGAGSSPILYQDLLIMNFDGSDHQFIIALDKKNWQNPLADQPIH